jgi:8-amino-7-oxononanoate synthase
MSNTNSANNLLVNALSERKEAGLLRSLISVGQLTDFCSNDYVGLAKNRELSSQISAEFAAWESDQALDVPIIGSTGSRLISGNHPYTEDFEKACAEMHHAPAALLFSSGFEANLGLIASLAQKEHVIFCDKLLHASLIDGLRLAPAERRIFKHNDLSDLVHLLAQYPRETIKWVVVESIYSMDGDLAPLKELVDLRDQYNFELIVDEAHAGGVYGPQGAGLCVELAIQDSIFARVITFGKAWGNAGAVVLGSEELRSYLVNFARPFIYSTAPTPHHVLSLQTSMGFVKQADSQRLALKENIRYFKTLQTSEDWGESNTAIQTFFVTGNEAVRAKAAQAQAAGFAVKPIVFPTVPKGKERIRITLTASTSPESMQKLVQTLESNA